MSLLKKLNKKVGPLVRPTMDREVAEKNMQNAVFQINSATFILMQRFAEGMDAVMFTKRNSGVALTASEARIIAQYEALVNQVTSLEQCVRSHYIVSPQEVLGIDDLNQQFHRIFQKMEQMSLRDVDLFEKVATTITTAGRYMHVDSEEEYLQTLCAAAQHGLELGEKGRKKVTLNDIKKLVKPTVNGKTT